MYHAFDVSGLVINLAGVLMLFRYGMPYRLETKGRGYFLLEDIDQNEVSLDKKYRLLGYIGVGLAIIGVLLQIAGSR